MLFQNLYDNILVCQKLKTKKKKKNPLINIIWITTFINVQVQISTFTMPIALQCEPEYILLQFYVFLMVFS